MDQGFRLLVCAFGTQGTLSKRSYGDLPAMCMPAGGVGNKAMVLTGGGRVNACLVDTDKNGDFDVAMFERYEKYFPLKSPARYQVVAESQLAPPTAEVNSSSGLFTKVLPAVWYG